MNLSTCYIILGIIMSIDIIYMVMFCCWYIVYLDHTDELLAWLIFITSIWWTQHYLRAATHLNSVSTSIHTCLPFAFKQNYIYASTWTFILTSQVRNITPSCVLSWNTWQNQMFHFQVSKKYFVSWTRSPIRIQVIPPFSGWVELQAC